MVLSIEERVFISAQRLSERLVLIQHFSKQEDMRKTGISWGNSAVYEVFALQKQFA
jgi:hypothetical protein